MLRRKVAWPTVALRGLVAAAEEERNLGWLAFFFAQICSEPHSTKGIDDLTGWARKTTPENLVSGVVNPALFPEMPEEEALEGVRCPVHGTDDRIADIATSRRWAEVRPDWTFMELEGSGHCGGPAGPSGLRRPTVPAHSFRRAPTACAGTASTRSSAMRGPAG